MAEVTRKAGTMLLPWGSIDLEAEVTEAWNNALGNGYDITKMSDEEIADDMIGCGGIPSDAPRDEVLKVIASLRQSADDYKQAMEYHEREMQQLDHDGQL